MESGQCLLAGSLSELDELIEYSYLYDFYGVLLKEKHRRIFEDYVQNNLSLREIAREHDMTRQGVHDVVKRCRNSLREYEEKLHLVHKFRLIEDRLHRIEEVAGEGTKENAARITELAEEIYDVI